MQADWSGELSLRHQLQLMALPAQRKRRINQKIGRAVIKQTRQNVRRQQSTTGQSFDKRKKKRRLRGKMLSGFTRGSNIKQRVTPSGTTVGFKNNALAKAAWAHQYGHKQTVTKAQQMRKARDWKDKPATSEQAAAMNRLGFRVEYRGGRKRKVSRAWIKKNLTRWQALGILRDLDQNRPQPKESWETELPARPFFANDSRWVAELANTIIRDELGR